MKRMKTLATAALAGLMLGAPSARSEAAVGQAAPAFALKDSKGTEHKLADAKGKYVVLEWTNPGCPFVRKHYDKGHMQKLQKEITGKGVLWFTVDSGAPGKGGLAAEKWEEQIKSKGIVSTAVLLDPAGGTGRAYGAKTTPHLYVINPDGVLIYAGAIDDKADTTTDPDSARNHVRVSLDEAMAGKPVSVPTTKAYGCGVKY